MKFGRRSKVEGRRSKVEGRRSKVEGRRSKVAREFYVKFGREGEMEGGREIRHRLRLSRYIHYLSFALDFG